MSEGARGSLRTGRGLPQSLRRLERQEGQALVEFALILPILMFILLGILDFGRAMNYTNNLTQLAAEGARSAAVNHNPDGTSLVTPYAGTIQQQIRDRPGSPEMRNNVTVCLTAPASGVAGVGQPVTVTTSMDFALIPYLGGTVHLGGKSTMRAEAPVSYTTGCKP